MGVVLGVTIADPVEAVEVRRGAGLGIGRQIPHQQQAVVIHAQLGGPPFHRFAQGGGYGPADQLHQDHQLHQLMALLGRGQGAGHVERLGGGQGVEIGFVTEQFFKEYFQQLGLQWRRPSPLQAASSYNCCC
jgi:hypothetical protein